MRSVWRLEGVTWKAFAKRVWEQIVEDRVTGQAAQLAFYFVLAVFPLLLALTALLGFFLQSEATLREALQKYLTSVAPESVSGLLERTLHEVASGSSGEKLSIGFIAALWAASNGMAAIIQAFNIAYDVKETRAWWKQRLVAIGLTVGFLVLITSALALLVYGPALIHWMAEHLGFGGVFTVLGMVLEWLVLLVFLVVAFNILYLYAPNIKHHRWHWLMPGTVAGIGLWLLASFGFKVYLHYFDRYSVTYGSIGAVIILLLWFYLSGIAILVGAEVNSEVEKASGGMA
jgi:membrane protein